MAFEQRPNMEVASLAARVPHDNGRLYVLGPFAARVSFASQQRRAISLVCAIDADLKLHGDREGLKMKRACIVGAGLAGLTASVTLAAYGCAAYIVERSHLPLDLTTHAKHREVHPTINFWPHDQPNLTTALPFLNWYQGDCNEVAKKIVSQWKQFAAKHAQIKDITHGCTVDDIKPMGEKWKIQCSGEQPEIDEFDIVILAMGFGPEKPLAGSDTPSYWDRREDVVNEVREHVPSTIQNYVVLGAGDGGLIEVLRLLYKNFAAGKVVFGTEQELTNEIVEQKIKKVEAEVKAQIADQILRGAFPLTEKIKDQISEKLWSVYAGLIPDLGKGFRDSVKDDSTNIAKIFLVGERPTPMDYSASPYHRLLIVHAMTMGRVEYFQVSGKGGVVVSECSSAATLSVGGKFVRLRDVTLAAKRFISLSGKRLVSNDSANQIALKQVLLLHRFGPESIVGPMLKKLDPTGVLTQDVQTRQLLYAEQDWISFNQICFLANELGLHPPSDKLKWLYQHLHEAEKFFMERFNLAVRVDNDKAGPEIILCPASEDPRWTDKNKAGDIPVHFFGVALRKSYVSAPLMSGTGH
jgi:thioredoxin reductase